MNLTEQLAGIAEKLGQLDTNNRGDLAEISRLTTMQNELLAQQALEERVQVQEIKVASITLPEGYDFNELWGDENANSIIIELLKDFRRQSDADHNGDINGMIIAHREELRAANDRELQLKRQNDELQAVNDHLQAQLNATEEGHKQYVLQLKGDIASFKNDIEDLANKRDAAVAKAEELEARLAEKAAINVTRIETTDRLASLVEASKQAKVKSALDIALENAVPFRGKVISEGVANLETPQVEPFRPFNQTSDTGFQLVTGPVSNDTEVDQVTPYRAHQFREEDLQALSTGLVEGVPGEVGESSKTIEERVKALELHVFGV